MTKSPASALRFADRKLVKQMIESCQLQDAVIDMDKDGFFAHSFTMPDWLAALPTKEEVAAQVATASVIADKLKRAPVRNIKNGACDRVRTWARANPEADKAAALAAFPDLNPSTVAIQLRKVRLGEV